MPSDVCDEKSATNADPVGRMFRQLTVRSPIRRIWIASIRASFRSSLFRCGYAPVLWRVGPVPELRAGCRNSSSVPSADSKHTHTPCCDERQNSDGQSQKNYPFIHMPEILYQRSQNVPARICRHVPTLFHFVIIPVWRRTEAKSTDVNPCLPYGGYEGQLPQVSASFRYWAGLMP